MSAVINQKQRNEIEREKARLRNKRRRAGGGKTSEIPKWYGWPGYVVPTWQLKDYIERHKHQWQAQYVPYQNETLDKSYSQNVGEEQGWRMVLATHAGLIMHRTPEAILRSLYDYMNEKRKIAHAQFADAVCLSLGHHMERDAGFTILPGCIGAAEELLTDRADMKGLQLARNELKRMAREAVALSVKIVEEKDMSVIEKAPLGCLRYEL